MEKFAKITAMVFAVLGIGATTEKLSLTAEQKETLDKAVKTEGFADKFQKRHNEQSSAEKDNADALAAITEFMAEEPSADSQPKEIPNGNDEPKALSPQITELLAEVKAIRQEKADLTANINKLKEEPEADSPETITGKTMKTIGHSETHLHGSNKSTDAFAGRNWNKLIAKQPNVSATEWNTMNIERLNKDVQDYFRNDPKKLHDMMLDAFEIPKYWKLISNVSDEYLHISFSTGEVTQGIKSKWLPKNKVNFSAQIGKVRDIQIDLEFQGYELKKMEKSYLNHYFNDASNPIKMDFVLWLVDKLLKKARKEDKICIGKGVYCPNDGDNAGSFLNNFSGVLKLADEQRGKTYNPFKLGKPTTENIHDYIKKFVESMPYEIQNLPDLIFYMSPSWVRAYNEARRRIKGRDVNYDGKIMFVDDFPNIELYAYDQADGSDFMFLTTKDNINILTDKLGENNVIEFTKPKSRVLEGAGDYKLGAHIAVFGRDLVDTPENSFENQLFFSNDVEVLTDIYVPVKANENKPSLKYHNSLLVGANNTKQTPIVNFKDVPDAGSIIYLRGNPTDFPSVVKDNKNIELTDGDCKLTKDTILVLYAAAGGKFIELERKQFTSNNDDDKIVLDTNEWEIDASMGIHFITSVNTKVSVISSIKDAVKSERYIIEGGSDEEPTTIKNGGLFKLKSDMILSEGKFIELFYNGDKFIELRRK